MGDVFAISASTSSFFSSYRLRTFASWIISHQFHLLPLGIITAKLEDITITLQSTLENQLYVSSKAEIIYDSLFVRVKI